MSLKNGSLVIRECMHFSLFHDPVMARKIKPQRAQSTQRVVISLFRPLCVLCALCGFPKPCIENIKKSLEFWSLQRENQRPKI